MKRRYPYEYVERKFKESHLTLIDKTYSNNTKPMKYQCDICGYVGKICFASIQQHGAGCRACGIEANTAKKRHSLEFIRTEFKKVDLELLSDIYKNGKENLKYKCSICGYIGYLSYNHLQQGSGCLGCSCSNGEKAVARWLSNNNIIYASQYTFNNLRSKRGRMLKFDFAIFKSDGKTLSTLLEFNGGQHYFPVDFCGEGAEHAQQQFIEGQARDQLKIDYCKSHDIPLLIIKYDQDIKQVLRDNLPQINE